jgi:hypothetical protein
MCGKPGRYVAVWLCNFKATSLSRSIEVPDRGASQYYNAARFSYVGRGVCWFQHSKIVGARKTSKENAILFKVRLERLCDTNTCDKKNEEKE